VTFSKIIDISKANYLQSFTKVLYYIIEIIFFYFYGVNHLTSFQLTAKISTADSRQQTADSRQQTADSRQQTADSRQQTDLSLLFLRAQKIS
jgi:hypothetical protein